MYVFMHGLFLARLLDALLAGVQRALLALGRVHHVLLRLGIYEYMVRDVRQISYREAYQLSAFP